MEELEEFKYISIKTAYCGDPSFMSAEELYQMFKQRLMDELFVDFGFEEEIGALQDGEGEAK